VLESFCLACALVSAEAILLLNAPEKWSDNPLVQRIVAREQAALDQGVSYDGRQRAALVQELVSKGRKVVPGVAQGMAWSSLGLASNGPLNLLPLSNMSNTEVVECNEGRGFLTYRSDEYGFNNPPGLASGPLDIAVFGASLALGHCVASSRSVVDLVRAQYPRTATFGVAGARVLSQLAIFREYVEPLKPPVVVWFVDTNLAVARDEGSQPLLLRYLQDPSFSQRLRSRQSEVDAFVRDILAPLNREASEALATELKRARCFPTGRLLRLREIRSVARFETVLRQPPPDDLSHFVASIDQVVESVSGWGGKLLVVVVPGYHLSKKAAASVARYRTVLESLAAADVKIVDGAALFDAQADPVGLFTLRVDNHPNERGHALLANAVLSTIEHENLL
jgi:hypothetical protein